MGNDLVQWLMNWAFDHGISVTMISEIKKDLPHCASAAKKAVLINLNYGKQREIPFALAHEIGHVVDDDSGIRYYQSATLHDKAEYRANCFGIRLLKKYCQVNDIHIDNPVHFCERFEVPNQLDYVVAVELSKSEDVKS